MNKKVDERTNFCVQLSINTYKFKEKAMSNHSRYGAIKKLLNFLHPEKFK
jgi:hypothetical protein